MAVKIQFRRDTSTNWESVNPILSQGEMGLDTTNNRFKLGDGSTAWNDLPYSVDFDPSGNYENLRAQATTKDDVGLGNVDNTSDANKPISNATQSALNTKADASALSSHTSDTTIHFTKASLVKGDVGLGNVDNTSDADKPISTLTQNALNLKADASLIGNTSVETGIASLESGKIPSSQLPSFVDDVLEFANLAGFPSENQEIGKIYVALDTNKTYRWSGSAYVEISPSLVPNDGTLTISGGSGLSGSGTFTADQATPSSITLTHADTSNQTNVDNSANSNFVKSMEFDAYGHVTSVTSGEVAQPDISSEYSAGVIETNDDSNLKFWRGTQAEFDALTVNNVLFNGILTNQVEQVIDVPLATFTASGKFTFDLSGDTYVAFENGEFQPDFDGNSFIDTDGTIYLDSDVGMIGNVNYSPPSYYGIKFEVNAVDPNKTTILWQGAGEPDTQTYTVIVETNISTVDPNTEYIITDEQENINSLSDVSITSPSNGQALLYNGTNWSNGSVSVPVTSVNGATGDVNISVPVTSVNGQTGAVTISTPPTLSTITELNGGFGQKISFVNSPSFVGRTGVFDPIESAFISSRTTGSKPVAITSWNNNTILSSYIAGGSYVYFAGNNRPYATRQFYGSSQTIALQSSGGIGRFVGGTTTGGFDVAELFENGTNKEIEPGILLTLNEKGFVVPSKENEQIIGVVSHTYGYLGNSQDFNWNKKELVDEWGRKLYKEQLDETYTLLSNYRIENPKDTRTDDEILKQETGVVEFEDEIPTINLPIINPDYKKQKYTPRIERPNEWTPVGLLGQVYVRTSQKLKPKDFVASDNNGFGVKSNEKTNIMVINEHKPFDNNKGYGIYKCLIK